MNKFTSHFSLLLIALFLWSNTYANDKDKIIIYLQKTIDTYHRSEFDSTIQLANKVIKISEKNNIFLEQKAIAYNVLGLTYDQLYDVEKAFYYLNLNTIYYKSTKNDKLLGYNYQNISLIFDAETNSYIEILKYNKLALSIFKSINDYDAIADIYLNMSATYGTLKYPNLDSVAHYLRLGLELTKSKKIKELEPYFQINLATYYLNNKEYEKAKILAQNAYKTFKYEHKGRQDRHNQFVIVKLLANISIQEGNYTQAEILLKEVEEIAIKLNRLSSLQGLNETYISFYKEQKQYDSVFIYLEKLNIIKDSIQTFKTDENLKKIEQKLLNVENKNAIRLLKEHQKVKKNEAQLLIISFLLSIVVFLFILYFFYKRKQKNELKINELKLGKELKISQIEKIEAENSTRIEKNKRLKIEIEFKNKEMNLLVISSINKNNDIITAIRSVEELYKDTKGEELKKHRKAMAILAKNVSTAKEWEFFKIRFDKNYPNFLQKIKETFPDLTTKETQLVAYIKAKLKNNDIATIMGISLKSVEMGKFRLKKKITLSTKDNLNKYIEEF